jgi:ectoine hydroxylase-related dioxygenase (phytanoyl-CoA dioxygenase family)
METAKIVRQIQMSGYAVLENVIPSNVIDEVHEDVVRVQAQHDAESVARQEATRAKGHRIGAKGVGVLKQVINYTQSFAPYLADRRIIDAAEAFFGPHVRISCTDAVVNHPGNERGYWHADWPYNQTNASNVRAPYPDCVFHLASIWMLTDFSAENGGTFVIPGSHNTTDNPSRGDLEGFDFEAPYPTEMNATGPAGSVLFYDSRLWHAVAPNLSDTARVALIVRYAPWWLNLNPTMIGRPEHTAMVVATGGKNYESTPIDRAVFDGLTEEVQALYHHFIAD